MKTNLLLFIVFLFIANSSCELHLKELYASKNGSYVFKIKEDSTFDYQFYQFHAYEYSQGTWVEKNNRKIILNSFRKDIQIPLILLESNFTNDSINRLLFEFKSVQIEAKDCECAIFINGSLNEIRRCDSISRLETHLPIREIFFHVFKQPLPITSFSFSLNPLVTNVYSTFKEFGNSSKFRIVVNDSLFSYKVFDNKVVKVKGKGIVYYDEKGERRHWIPARLR